jgi:hypothetical protein
MQQILGLLKASTPSDEASIARFVDFRQSVPNFCFVSAFFLRTSLYLVPHYYAGNNEVASVSNGSIASTRITNCAQMKNAVVYIPLKLHISLLVVVHDDLNVEKFKDGVQNYISNNLEAFDGLGFFGCNDINSDDEYVMYDLCVCSRHSWQEAGRVLEDRDVCFSTALSCQRKRR